MQTAATLGYESILQIHEKCNDCIEHSKITFASVDHTYSIVLAYK